MIKPIFLLADSQLLFTRVDGESIPERARRLFAEEEPGKEILAAYIGASNDDAKEFYDLFVAAMDAAGIRRTRMIPAAPSEADTDFLNEADVILLAGGDTRRGWKAFKENGWDQTLIGRYYAGAVLIGVSAGAVQLGLKGADEDGKTFDTLRLVPFVLDAHDEPGWARLLQTVPKAGEHARGFGIPTGGGAVYHPDYSVEPIRHPLNEVSLTEEGTVRQALLFPGESAEADPEERGSFSPEVQALLGMNGEAPAADPDSDPNPADPDDTVN